MHAFARIPVRLAAAVAIVIIGSSATIALADYRLDTNVAPTSQKVSLEIDAERADYRGSVHIDLRVARRTEDFQFHAQNMTFDRVVLTGRDGEVGVEIEDGDEGLRTVRCARALEPGDWTLDIDFHKEFNTKAVGLYRITHEGRGYIFSQFEAIDARRAFPCWDEPIYKIPYQITLTVPIQQEALTNTPVERQTMGATTRTITFRETPPTPSYLLAVAAGPLESVPISGLSVPGRVYTVRGQKHLAKMAVQVTPPILGALEAFFERPYPYEKLDLIAIPEYWPGAMENPGAVTYRDGILLVDSDAASAGQMRLLVRVTAHELAHMWFGDLVTMAWWDDLWLNESFADWLGDKVANGLYPQYEIAADEAAAAMETMKGDARPSTVPVRKPVESTAEMMEGVGLAYNKGKTVLGMVEARIGEDKFRAGVRAYIEAHAWGNTVAGDLFAALSNEAGEDLEPIFSSFLDQPGFPVVSVEADGRGLITLRQRRFLNHGVETDDLRWKIPVRVKYSDGEQTVVRTLLLAGDEARVETGGPVAWVHPNAGARGYYAWSAPLEMLLEMATRAPEVLDERERATYLANARALLDAGAIGGDDYLGILSAFAAFPETDLVTAVVDGLGDIEKSLVRDDARADYRRYIRETLGPALTRVGVEPVEGEPEAVALLRPRLIGWLGARGEDPAVRERCKEMAAAYMTDPASVDAAIAGQALRVAAMDGSREDFERCRNKYEAAKNPADRGRFLSAMGWFQNPALQDEALAYALTGKVLVNEMFYLLGGIGLKDAGDEKIWAWLTENYDTIAGRVPEMFRAYMPYFASGCSEERLAAARAFFADPAHSVDGTDKNMQKVAEQVTDCVNLREREGDAVAS
ncbi:MAG: M1 family metallopeptidase, partial [Candidatus Krumholzibacteria bacterium]|nr:M1 family metallopeptidase [Candidatus Krumholzibacteria bacterium]